jgi:DNA-binding beta-propeller fold protein YncE
MKRTVANLVFAVLLGLCFDVPSARADTIYVSTFNENTILKFDSAGNQSTFATASSGLDYPLGLAFDSGNLYVANVYSGTIEKFDSGGNGSIFANLGSNAPYELTSDNHGNLYALVLDSSGFYDIDRFDSMGNLSILVSSNFPSQDYGFQGLAFDSNGNLYVDTYDGSILKFNTNWVGSVFATSHLYNPQGLAFDNGGNLYVANGGNNTIYKFDPSGNGSLFAGSPSAVTNSGVSFPIGIAFGSSGNLFVASHGDSAIEEENSSGIGTVFALGFNADDIAIEVPEPSSLLLLGLGLCGLAFSHRRR